ncbi:hypothetical protein Taro_002512 [Colocasia esculenta]|uniref:Rhodopsin n=1 Tax=Colocasia esculenta TaxID=4460 RepID=A0A843THC4_COLES|nr:hypothetical protein [Colocasia esculenta]
MSYYNQQQPPVGVPPPQGYPPEGYAKDAYPPPGYPPQGYPPAGYPAQGYPPQGYPPQGYPPQGYAPPPPQGYAQPPPPQKQSSVWLHSAVAACWMLAFEEDDGGMVACIDGSGLMGEKLQVSSEQRDKKQEYVHFFFHLCVLKIEGDLDGVHSFLEVNPSCVPIRACCF